MQADVYDRNAAFGQLIELGVVDVDDVGAGEPGSGNQAGKKQSTHGYPKGGVNGVGVKGVSFTLFLREVKLTSFDLLRTVWFGDPEIPMI